MNHRIRAALAAAALLVACGPDFSPEGLGTDIDFDPDRPEILDARVVAPYAGSNPYVTDAQKRYRTGLDLQQKVIHRTCTPNDGVCHNRKEYPDLHTPANFANAIGARCNVQPGDYTSVWDRCEPQGDLFQIRDSPQSEVAWIDMIVGEEIEFGRDNPPTEASPGLHIVLRGQAPETDQGGTEANARFFRDFDGESLVYARFRTVWWKVGPNRVMGVVNQDRSDAANRLVSAGIRQGDQNRNGVFGSQMGPNIPMINPGKPEQSYLVARIRGEAGGEPIPGSRMPLANQPLDIADMLGLFCFIEGLSADEEPNLADGIDYNSCSYAVDPENLNLLGDGVTWATRISKILEANCGGCHGGGAPQEGFDVLADGAYDRLLQPSVQVPEMPLVTPGDPTVSYLWLKITGADGIMGDRMPLDPLMGTRTLSEAELGDIETWIVNGAQENE